MAQVNTVTPTASNNATYTLTVNSKDSTITADASATVAEITAAAIVAWNADDEGEMEEITAVDSTTLVTMTADTPGVPFTQTSSSSAGAYVTATTVNNSSPNDINNSLNWTDGIPNAADDCVLDAGGANESLYWNLGALSAITLTSFTRRKAFTGKIGLPEYNTSGQHSYFEYRATELAISATTMRIEQPASDGAEHLKFNVAAVATTLTVLGESAGNLGSEAMWWRGTNAANVVNVINASLAIAVTNLNSAVVATLNNENGTVRCGSGVTLTTVLNDGGTMELNSNVVTLTTFGTGSTTYCKGSMTVTTAKINEGTLVYQSSGTIATLTPGPKAVLDFSQGSGAVTVTNAVTLPAGVTINDPDGRVVWSGGLTLGTGVRIADVSLDVGTGRALTVT